MGARRVPTASGQAEAARKLPRTRRVGLRPARSLGTFVCGLGAFLGVDAESRARAFLLELEPALVLLGQRAALDHLGAEVAHHADPLAAVCGLAERFAVLRTDEQC